MLIIKRVLIIMFCISVVGTVLYSKKNTQEDTALQSNYWDRMPIENRSTFLDIRKYLEVDYDVPDLVPFHKIIEIVQRYVKNRWNGASIDESIPCCDLDGKIRVYMFPVCVDSKKFPPEQGIWHSVLEGPNRIQMLGTERYKTVVISARYCDFPIPAVFHSLPGYYSFMPAAFINAKRNLKNINIRLSRIYFLGIIGSFFEFSTESAKIIISSDINLLTFDKDEFFNRWAITKLNVFPNSSQNYLLNQRDNFKYQIQESWRKLQSGNISSGNKYYVMGMDEMGSPNNKNWVPRLLWTGGCSPTSAAMALGYWDNYIFNDGGVLDEGHFYGRLIDYYLTEPNSFCRNPGYYSPDIPNLLLELRNGMETYCEDSNNNGYYEDNEIGLTKRDKISIGIEYATNANNYSFESNCYWDILGHNGNWIWEQIKNEVINSRPFVYSVSTISLPLILPGIGHSLCGIGYTDDGYVIVIDPNGAAQEEWLFYYWEYEPRRPAVIVQVDTIEPGGSESPNQLFLKSPIGYERIESNSLFQIKWQQWGNQITHVDIYFSKNGGQGFEPVASNCISSPEENKYPWYPNVSTTTGRIKIVSNGSPVVASDGSRNDVFIHPTGVSPSDNAKVSTLEPTFQWTPFESLDNRIGYQLRVRCDTDGDILIYETGLINDSSSTTHLYQPGAFTGTVLDPVTQEPVVLVSETLEYGKHYHWHVRYYVQKTTGNFPFWTQWSNDSPETHMDFYPVISSIRTPIDSIDFGNVYQGTSTEKSTNIYNDGSEILTITNITRSSGSSYFTYQRPPTSFEISPGQFRTIWVKYYPYLGGSHNAVFTVYSSDTSNPEVTFNVTGAAGQGPKIRQPLEYVAFGEVKINTDSYKTATIYNDGTATLIVSNVSGDSTSFKYSGPTPPINIPAGDSRDVTIKFHPYSIGRKINSFQVYTNDPYGSTVQLNCEGYGVEDPNIRTPVNSINFGDVNVHASSTNTTTIYNDAYATLTINDISWVSGSSNFTRVDPATPFNISANQSKTISIRFLPLSEGAKSATFRINSNDPDSPNVNFSVSGNGIGTPAIRKPVTFIDFGNVYTDSFLDKVTTIYNDGTGSLTINNIQWSSGSTEFSYIGPQAPFVVGVNDSQTITIRFAPLTVGNKSSLFTINSNDPNDPDVLFNVSGTGFVPFPAITVTSPNGGESWDVGSNQTITWTSEGTVGNVMIEFSTNGGNSWGIISQSTENDGSYNWKVPNRPSDNCLVRISETGEDGSPSDVSNAVFSIVSHVSGSITLRSPNGGESWLADSSQQIKWKSTGTINNVTIKFSKDNGTTWKTIAQTTPNDHIYNWVVPETVSDKCLVRVTANDSDLDPKPSDVSDAVFSIVLPPSPTIRVTAPNGGEQLEMGSRFTVTWDAANTREDVRIEYSVNGGETWKEITTAAENNGKYDWIVADEPSDNCLVRVSETGGQPSDVSDALFSIVSPVPGDITVISPNGGEAWTAGSSQEIKWTAAGIDQVKIEYSRDHGTTWDPIMQTTPNSGSFDWTVPGTASDECLVRITSNDANSDPIPADISDAVFSIVPPASPTITVIAPNGGEQLLVGSRFNITWDAVNSRENVKIEYSLNGGETWPIITDATENNGDYEWIVPGTPSETCLVRISETDGQPVDVSDAVFSIVEPGSGEVTVISPNGGESWTAGTIKEITWTAGGINNVTIEYTIDYGTTWQVIAPTTPNDGSFDWTIPGTVSDECLVRVSSNDGDPDPVPSDVSDQVFSITPGPTGEFRVTSPNGGEKWEVGTIQSIKWTNSGGINTVMIEYSRDNGNTWNTIVSSVSNSGAYDWTIPDTVSDDCLVRVSANDGEADPQPTDVSDAVFSILRPAAPTIRVITPNGGEQLVIGTIYEITWFGTDSRAEVKIEYSINGGETWIGIIGSTENDGEYDWPVPDESSETCLVRISEIDGQPVDVSDAVFSIVQPQTGDLTVFTPNGGENLESGSEYNITWTCSGFNNVIIEYSVNNGVTWLYIDKVPVDNGSYTWTVPGTPSEMCLVRLTGADSDENPSDVSDEVFTIFDPTQASIEVFTPNGGESLCVGEEYYITWASTGINNVLIEYSTTNGEEWIPIDTVPALGGRFTWTVPDTPSESCLIRISGADSPGDPSDVSDAVFSITAN